jgi:hypothetical protein
MPRDIVTTVYTLDELIQASKVPGSGITKRAVDRAIDWIRDGQCEGDWYDCEYAEWKETLAKIGFEKPDISFSGFSTQGSGASFTAEWTDLSKLAAFMTNPESAGLEPFALEAIEWKGDKRYSRLKWIAEFIDGPTCKRTSSHYVHEHTCTIEADLRDKGDQVGDYSTGKWVSHTPRVRAFFEEWLKDAEQLRKDISRAIYAALESQHDYLTSDEACIESAEGNDWTFDASGNREG